jgi:hypothetical protein
MEDIAPELQPQQIDSKLRRNSSSAAADAVSQLLGMTGGLPETSGGEDSTRDPRYFEILMTRDAFQGCIRSED